MAEKIVCDTTDQFEDILGQYTANIDSQSVLYLLFTGTKSSSTGLSWCGDCVRAEPIINDSLNELPTNTKIVICDVKREEYRSPDYIYRNHPLVALKCVPTLIKLVNGKKIISLNDNQCQDPELVKEFFNFE
eukprot:gene8188-11077_t